MAVLFVHGGGDDAFRFDSEIVTRLREAIGPSLRVEYPRIAGLERIEWPPVFADLSERLSALPPDACVVAHSAGGVAMLKILSGLLKPPIRNLFLLATPYKAEDSHWGIDDFTFPSDFPDCLDQNVNVTIYHSKDDTTIPVEDAILYQRKMPKARVRLLDGYGHQFTGSLDFLASDIHDAFRGQPRM